MERKFPLRNFPKFGLYPFSEEVLLYYTGNFLNSNRSFWSILKPFKLTTFGNSTFSTRDLRSGLWWGKL